MLISSIRPTRLANIAGNLIGFDETATSTLAWLLLGTMTALAVSHQPVAAKQSDAPRAWRRSILAILGIGLGLSILLFNLRPVVADSLIRSANSLVSDHPGAAVRTAERAVQWWPRESQYFIALAGIAEQYARVSSDGEEVDLRTTEAALQRAIALQPQRFDLWLELGRFYARWPGPSPNRETAEQAHAAFREAVDRAPQHSVVYGSWGGLLQAEGQLPAALEMFRKAVDLDATDFAAWTNLGQIQLAVGRGPEARFSFERANAIAPRLVPPLIGLAEATLRMGEIDDAATAIDQALAIEPENEAALALARELQQGPPGAS